MPIDAPSPAAVRGRLLTFRRAPSGAGDLDSVRYLEDGAVAIDGGRIRAVGEAAGVLGDLPDGAVVDHHPGALLMAGFIDAHIHLPQTQVIASFGARLMEWLERYTFVEEAKFADPAHAARNAGFFLDELLRNGTTTAAVYGSSHPGSAEALFAAAEARGMGLVAGKAMMDRNAPESVRDRAEASYEEGRALIARWHGRGRQRYAVTPRFAITSTEAQLEAAGALLRDHPGVLMQTHLSENPEEIAAVRALFPNDSSYAAVYHRFGLTGPRSLFGHCIHLDEGEMRLLSETGSVAVLCPTSNLFIGSGLFDVARLSRPDRPVRQALATDVGGGSSYSMLRTAAEAYKVMQLRGQVLPALDAFHRMTRGNAEALGLVEEIGVLEPGRHADLVVMDARATPAMAHRMETVETLEEELFVLMTLGDDRAVRAAYVGGRLVRDPLRP